jgi:hypothetical protein
MGINETLSMVLHMIWLMFYLNFNK